MDIGHFRAHIVRPVLDHLGLHTPAAEDLLVGTAIHESGGLKWLRQRGGGPALGLYQIEPGTHDWLIAGYLTAPGRRALGRRVDELVAPWPARREQLVSNLAYATAVARLRYLPDPEPIPDNIEGQARYWKRVYNTAHGAGTVAEYVENYRRFAT